MTLSVEVRMERMDSKLEKHIGITETILKNQQDTLGEIRDIVKEHASKFISHDEVELMEMASNAKTSEEINNKLAGFENRMDKKYSKIVGAVIVTVVAIFGLLEVLPVNIGGN